jgi:hypothetical protein
MTNLIKHVNRYCITPSGLELFANFYYPPKCQDGEPRGLFVAYHGGGVINGSRDEEFINEPVRRESAFHPSRQRQCRLVLFCLRDPEMRLASRG